MLRRKIDALEWLEFSLFQNCRIKHGSFLRHGGVSISPYASLNFGALPEDLPENLVRNHTLAKNALSIPHLYFGHQCHGKKVVEVNFEMVSNKLRHDCDALMTDHKGIGLMIKHADCQAAIFYDPIHHALGVAHSGWRGSVANIYLELILAMQARYNTNPSDLLVAIGPSLGPKKAEFRNFESELPKEFHEFQLWPTYFDFWAISKEQLLSAGVLSHHIEMAHLCTYENQNDFFSYRRDKVTGRHATIAALI